MDPNPSRQNPALSGAADKWHWQVEMVSTPSNRKTWVFIETENWINKPHH